MPDDDRQALLARRYRRWLLAYPRSYRRERGPEILATLLESAGPVQTRPAAREARRLLGHGLARRVVDTGARAVVVMIFGALVGGLSGIALGSYLSWRQVSPLAPDRATATRLAATVLPAPATGPDYYGYHTFWNPNSEHKLLGGTGLRVGRAEFDGTVADHADFRALATAAADRMRTHGWHDVRSTVTVYPPHTSPAAHAEVTGRRDGILAGVEIDPSDEANPTHLGLDLMWDAPPGQPTDTVAGGVAGLLIGGLFGLCTARRVRARSQPVRWTYSGLCVLSLLMLAPACLGNIPTASGSLLSSTQRNGTGPPVFWAGFVFFGAEPLAILSVVPILAILVLCLWPRPATIRTATTA